MACMTIAELSRTSPVRDGLLLGFAAFSPDVIRAMRPSLEKAFRPLL